MTSWLFDPLVVHLALLAPAGVVLVFASVLQNRPVGQAARGRRLLFASSLTAAALCGLLGADATLRSMPYPYRVFPLVFLGLFVVSRETTTHLLQWTLNGFIAALRSPRLQLAGFLSATAALLIVLTVEPLLHEEDFGTPRDDADLWSQVDRFQEVTPSPLRSDQGRPVRVMAFTSGEPATGLEKPLLLLQRTLLARWEFQDKVIALPMAWLPCNCHGYVFAAGKYLVPSEEVDAILLDNGYNEVSRPRLGDVIVYRNAQGAVVHSGLVRGLGDGVVFVESKWGKLGRFLHPHTVWAQRDTTPSFYRSARHGHTLLPASQAEAVGAE